MSRQERRRAAAQHLRLASSNGKEQPSAVAKPRPADPASVPWCVHAERKTVPRYAIGTRIRCLDTIPIVELRGATATIVSASQRLCRLLGPGSWARTFVKDANLADVMNRYHDEPAYYIDHVELADGRTHLDTETLAFPTWATEAWIEPLIKVGP